MTELHPTLRALEMPRRLRVRPIDERGYPVPFFVAIVDGKPDHRVSDGKKFARCVERNLCWLCGERLGVFVAFVLGPISTLTRLSSEPPSHRDCALYAVQACPFLSRPHAKRREIDDERVRPYRETAGEPVERNPGVSVVWVTRSYRMHRAQKGNQGYLFEVSDPAHTFWWAGGRAAKRDEVEASTREALPIVRNRVPLSGYELGLLEIDRTFAQVQRYWPPAVPT